jgi:hypothetical protein
MKTLVKLNAVFSEDKGLEIATEIIPVVKENDNAVVLETEDFKTVYKGDVKNDYTDYIDEPKKLTVYGLSKIVGVGGYFTTRDKAEQVAKDEVNKYLTDKVRYYEELIILFDNPIKKQ